MCRNRISKKDTIKAYSYNRYGKLISIVYDSGFHTIASVISVLKQKAICSSVHEVAIHNQDKEWYCYYTSDGKKK